MKIVEVANTDFALRHFVLPLMQAMQARGHEVIGACADGPLLDDVRQAGFRVEVMPFERNLSPMAHLRGVRALYRLFRSETPDLVHAHMPISGFLARLAAKAADVPRIAYTCHGYQFNKPAAWTHRLIGFATEFLAGQITDVHLTVSQEEAAESRRYRIHRGSSAIGNGRDPLRFRPDPVARAKLRAELGVSADAVVIVVIARLVRHKGHPELLAALREVAGAELWVVGERLPSDHGEDIAPYFVQSGLGARLRLLGTRTDIPAILAASDIFALPSHFEGLPMSIVEAMLCGLPVVSTDIRGPREQVIDGQTGFLVPPHLVPPLAEALQRLVNDAGRRARMGAAARARAESEFDEGRVLARTLDLLGVS